MIVGTAGHIDHGKSTLVQALTGVNPDRLPEEQRRGMTIELGYASCELTDDTGRAHTISFVDVPGHEKLVRTMVAGASGLGFALLLVAADDGVMPQTEEHATILDMLAMRRGAVVLTKVDRVSSEQREQRWREAVALAERLGWTQAGSEKANVVAVSAWTGEGLDDLRALLLAASVQQASTSCNEGAGSNEPALTGFRMGLDRVMTLDGVGTIVAGSVLAGRVSLGDELVLSHAPGRPYRVRSLQQHGRRVTQAVSGERCAVGLVGLERDQVARGQVLCAPALATGTQRFDATLQVARSETKALRSGMLAHVHVGVQSALATLVILDKLPDAAGATPTIFKSGNLADSLLVQWVVKGPPLQVVVGDRLVVRDASATRTLAGGQVLDPEGWARYRASPERLASLRAFAEPDARRRCIAVLAADPWGFSASSWLQRHGYLRWPFDLASVPEVVIDRENDWCLHQDALAQHQQRVLTVLQSFHQDRPSELGLDVARARRLAVPRMPNGCWALVLARLLASDQVVLRRGFLQRMEHSVRLAQTDRVAAERLLPLMLAGGNDPPWVRDLALQTGLPELQVRAVLGRMGQAGEAYQVIKDLYFHPTVVAQLAQIVRHLHAERGEVTAAQFRDATGLGRKRAIQILEFFDRVGLLRRVRDIHLLRADCRLFEVSPS